MESSLNNSWQGWISAATSKMSLRTILLLAGVSRVAAILEIESRGGFEVNLEVTVKAFLGGYSIVEIPTTWRDRTRGKSRFRIWAWLPRYLKWYAFAFRPRRMNPDRPVQAASTTQETLSSK